MRLKNKFFSIVLIAAVLALGLAVEASAEMQGAKATFKSEAALQQPSFTDYRGVKLGMSVEETRAKLGTPSIKYSDQDLFVMSENESAQIFYDAAQKVVTISIDYINGIGAPDYKAVVGVELETRANGSLHKLVRFESRGFWASYHRTNSPVPNVTVTLQKL